MSKNETTIEATGELLPATGEPTLIELSSRLTELDETLRATRQSVYESFIEYLKTAHAIGVALWQVKQMPGISAAGKPKSGEISFSQFLSESSWSFKTSQMASHYCALARFETADELIEAISEAVTEGQSVTSLVDAAKLSRKALPTPEEVARAATRPPRTTPTGTTPTGTTPTGTTPTGTTPPSTSDSFSFVAFCDWLKTAKLADVQRVRAALEARELELSPVQANAKGLLPSFDSKPRKKAPAKKAPAKKATAKKAA